MSGIWNHHGGAYLALFLAGMLLAYLLTPAVRTMATLAGAIDQPGGRKLHTGQTPLWGGIAVALPFVLLLTAVTALPNVFREALLPESDRLAGIVGACLIMLAAGMADDLYDLRPRTKLCCQIVAATWAYACGVRIDQMTLPFFGSVTLESTKFFMTLLWLVGLTNAVNLIDGLDGLATGVMMLAALGNFVIALMLGNCWMALASVLLAGALLGFLRFNFPPASIFLGDAGSQGLGMLVACMSLASSQKSPTLTIFVISILILGLPVMDTSVTIVRRWLRGVHPFRADHGHLHHLLQFSGLSKRQSLLILYVACVFFVVLGILTMITKSLKILGFTFSFAAGIAITFWLYRRLVELSQPPAAGAAEKNDVPCRSANLARGTLQQYLLERVRNAATPADMIRTMAIFGLEYDIRKIDFVTGNSEGTATGEYSWTNDFSDNADLTRLRKEIITFYTGEQVQYFLDPGRRLSEEECVFLNEFLLAIRNRLIRANAAARAGKE